MTGTRTERVAETGERAIPDRAPGAPAGPAGIGREWLFLAAGALLFAASAGATIYLHGGMAGSMATPIAGAMGMPGSAVAAPWAPMPGQSWLGAGVSFLGMWVVMMVAMMQPALVPVLSSYRRQVVALGGSGPGRAAALAGVGYFLVWTAFGAVAFPLGAVAAAGLVRWPAVARAVPVATGAVLLLAGWFQMTRWKAGQLERCRSGPACGPPPTGHARSAWRFGLRLGLHCALCCAGLMVALLVTGVMDLVVMAVVACAITLERLAPWPRLAARTAGAVALGAGAVALVRAL